MRPAMVDGELLVLPCPKAALVVRLTDVIAWIQSDRDRWAAALRRGKSWRRDAAMKARMSRKNRAQG